MIKKIALAAFAAAMFVVSAPVMAHHSANAQFDTKQDIKLGGTYEFRIAPAWKDPEGEKLGFMKAITINGKEYVVVEL